MCLEFYREWHEAAAVDQQHATCCQLWIHHVCVWSLWCSLVSLWNTCECRFIQSHVQCTSGPRELCENGVAQKTCVELLCNMYQMFCQVHAQCDGLFGTDQE